MPGVRTKDAMWLDALREAWGIFARQPVPFLLATLIYGIAATAIAGASDYALPRPGSALVLVLMGPCLGGISLMAQQARAGDMVDLNEAFAPWRRAGDYLVVGLAVAAGTLLLVVGVLATYGLCLFAPALVAEGATYAEALARSRDLVVSQWRQVVPLVAVTICAVLISFFLTFSLGLLVVVPVATLANCILLDRLRASAATPSVDATPSDASEGDAPDPG